MADSATATETGTTETGTTSTEVGTWLVDTLGDKLVGQDGPVATEDLLENEIVSFYFSAHWCPPCRGFTPKLAETYKTVTGGGKGWDVIFISSDKDQGAFDSYFNEHPWKALPFEKRDLKAKLSKKFKVQGIPSLIMLNPRTGEIWNKEGRSAIMGDPKGEKFPWENRPKTFLQIWESIKVVTSGGEIEASDLLKKKYIAIYFSAHWCPPCRAFTPKLVEWYNEYAEKFDVEVVFNSWDKTDGQFQDYYKDMPWAARAYDDKQSKEDLDQLYEINGIPAFVVIDTSTGQLVTSNGRSGVMGEPEGFPWGKKPVMKLGGDAVDALNGCPCMYTLCQEKNTDSVIKAVTPAAEFYVEACKAAGEWPGLMEIEFIVDNGTHDLSGRVKGLLKLKDDEKLFIMDLSDKALYNCAGITSDADITADKVSKFMEQYRKGELKKRVLDL